MARSYQVAVLPGEGIGPEVVAAAVTVLREVAQLEGFEVSFAEGLIGIPAEQASGVGFPEETARLCAASDGILFGAVSRSGLLELRQHGDFFANLRPIRTSPSLISRTTLKPELVEGLDILMIRELVSGIYFGPSGRDEDERGPYGYHTMRYHDDEIRRVARVALEHAARRRGKLTVAHKENALPKIPWVRLTQEEAAAFPSVTVEPMLVDTMAMQLVRAPLSFDVILAENLFGDIISDIGAALVGSIGVLPSASLNADGKGMYEAIHGTAPDIAGQDKANPLGTISAMAMMLEQWGETQATQAVYEAQERLLSAGYRTGDIATGDGDQLVGTTALTAQLIEQLRQVYGSHGQ